MNVDFLEVFYIVQNQIQLLLYDDLHNIKVVHSLVLYHDELYKKKQELSIYGNITVLTQCFFPMG